MGNKLTQSRIKIVGVADKDGYEASIVCTKTTIGSTDRIDNPAFDLSSRFTFGSIKFNNAFKTNPVFFPFREGLEYSIAEIKQICIDNGYDAWISELGDISSVEITPVGFFFITEDDNDLITEDGLFLITG